MKFTKFFSPGVVGLCLVIIGLSAVCWNLGHQQRLDPDELESLQAAWLITQGSIPYRDFYQIHPPLFYVFLTPFFHFFPTLQVVSAGRELVWLILLINGYLVFLISRRLFDRQAGFWSVICYFNSVPVMAKMSEVRPDVGMMLFTNLALAALIMPSRLMFLAGVFASLAVLCKQTGLIFLAGLGIFFIVRRVTDRTSWWQNNIFESRRFSMRTLVVFSLGFVLVLACFSLFLISRQAFGSMWDQVVNNDFTRAILLRDVGSFHWFPGEKLRRILNWNLFVFFFAAVSLIQLIHSGRQEPSRRGTAVFFAVLLFVFWGSLWLILHPWMQEFFLAAQYTAVLAGFSLAKVTNILRERSRVLDKIPYLMIVCALLAGICVPAVTSLGFKRGQFKADVRFLDVVLAFTNPHDVCFSPAYPCLLRPGLYYYRVGSMLLESPAALKILEPLVTDDFRQGNVTVFIPGGGHGFLNMPAFRRLIEKHYTPCTIGQLECFVPGGHVSLDEHGRATLTILKAGRYSFRGPGLEEVIIDGNRHVDQDIFLTRGTHQLAVPRSGGTVFMYYDLIANKSNS